MTSFSTSKESLEYGDLIEDMPSRIDGNCSRCSTPRLLRDKKPFKAKWVIHRSYSLAGRVNKDGSPATPLLKKQYDELIVIHGSEEKMFEAMGSKKVGWYHVCGYCKNSELNSRLYYDYDDAKVEKI
jgi:hypothetical protein